MNTSANPCQAKNPATCRFHGAQRFAPQNSKRALREVQELKSRIKHPTVSKDPVAYLQLKGQLAEAEVNYSVTKEGFAKITKEYEDAMESNLENPSKENATVAYNAANAYFNASSTRQSLLENYSDALVEENFPSDPDKKVAELAMLNNFAQFEADGDFDSELKHAGLTRGQFNKKLADPIFAEKLEKVEATFVSKAQETKSQSLLFINQYARDNLANYEVGSQGYETQLQEVLAVRENSILGSL